MKSFQTLFKSLSLIVLFVSTVAWAENFRQAKLPAGRFPAGAPGSFGSLEPVVVDVPLQPVPIAPTGSFIDLGTGGLVTTDDGGEIEIGGSCGQAITNGGASGNGRCQGKEANTQVPITFYCANSTCKPQRTAGHCKCITESYCEIVGGRPNCISK